MLNLGLGLMDDIRLALLASQARKEELTERVGKLMIELRDVIYKYEVELVFIQDLKMCSVITAPTHPTKSTKFQCLAGRGREGEKRMYRPLVRDVVDQPKNM
jgi:hypothetical protein